MLDRFLGLMWTPLPNLPGNYRYPNRVPQKLLSNFLNYFIRSRSIFFFYPP